MEQNITIKTLDNGIRIIIEEMPTLRSASIGLWFKTGSRYESEEDAGISHFVEHLVFKGSENYSCRELAEKIDMLGGNIDAFTSREFTSYVAKVTDDQLYEALSLLIEVVFHPAMREEDIALEKDVILEEIKMVQDTPDDLVHEIFSRAVYGDHPLGRSILGTEETVGGFDRHRIERFFENLYSPDRLVIAITGNVNPDEAIDFLDKTLGHRRPGEQKIEIHKPEFIAGKVLLERENLEQVQLLVGVEAFGKKDPRKPVLETLNTYLGGSVSSRLFQNVREKLGLAYSISSFVSSFADAGFLSVYAATGPNRLHQLMDVIRYELETIARGVIEFDQIARVKQLIKSDVVLGMESSSNRMAFLARQMLYFDDIKTMDVLLNELKKVSPEAIAELAGEILAGADLAVTAIGNLNGHRLNLGKLA